MTDIDDLIARLESHPLTIRDGEVLRVSDAIVDCHEAAAALREQQEQIARHAADMKLLRDAQHNEHQRAEKAEAERDEHARWRADLADKLHEAEAERDAAMKVIEAAKAMRNWLTLVDLIPRMEAFDAALAKLERKIE